MTQSIPKIIKREDGLYEFNDCCYQDIQGAFVGGMFDLCGCASDELATIMCNVLCEIVYNWKSEEKTTNSEELAKKLNISEEFCELIFLLLGRSEFHLITHGGNIKNSWPSANGVDLVKNIKEFL